MFARSAFFLLVTLGFGSLAGLFSFIGVATPLPYRPSSDLARRL
jgi:hypothetical protein